MIAAFGWPEAATAMVGIIAAAVVVIVRKDWFKEWF